MSRNQTIILITSCFGLMLLCGFALFVPLVPVLQARQKWNDRPYDHYRLEVDITTLVKFCHYSVDVTGNQIVAVNQNWCDEMGWGYIQPLQPQTVDGLLDQFADEQYEVYCSPAGCRCGTPVRNQIEWHPELGYPTSWTRGEVELPVDVLPECTVYYETRIFGRVNVIPLD